MQNIMGKLQELRIELVLADIEKRGYYVQSCRTIIASNSLSELELKEVILHELKHIISHADYIDLYNCSFVARSKMEREANTFMITELIKENEGYFNYSNILENYQFGLGSENMLVHKNT